MDDAGGGGDCCGLGRCGVEERERWGKRWGKERDIISIYVSKPSLHTPPKTKNRGSGDEGLVKQVNKVV